MTKPQVWFCEKCGTIGNVMIEEHADVWSVSNQIREAHLQYRPKCGYKERVIIVENLETDQILCAGR